MAAACATRGVVEYSWVGWSLCITVLEVQPWMGSLVGKSGRR